MNNLGQSLHDHKNKRFPLPWGLYKDIHERMSSKSCRMYSATHIANVLNGRAGYSPSFLRSLSHTLEVDREWTSDYIEWASNRKEGCL